MTRNPWKENFSKTAKRAVNVQPILLYVGIVVLALAMCEFGRFVGVLERSDWNNTIQSTLLGATLIMVLMNSAKINLLKRTVDQNARYRSTNTLWLDKINEVSSEKQTDK